MPNVGRIGIYEAEVMNIENFKDTGKIQIRALGLNIEDTWVEAKVLTPFGGNPNMGIQFLPPIGSLGYVLYERGENTSPVWMGNVMRTWGDEFEEGWGNPVEAEDHTDFVIKTQHTKFDDREIDTDSNKVENIIRLNETELSLSKVRQDSPAYQYEKESYNFEDKPYNIVKLTDEEIKIKFKFKDNSKSNTISLEEDKVEMSFDTDAGEMKTVVREDSIELVGGSSIVKISKDGNVEINTSSNKIKLNGDNFKGTLYEGLRDFVNQAFNSHIHGTPSGPSSPPKSPYTAIKSAKSESVELT